MFAKPATGELVKVTTDWSDYFKSFDKTMQILNNTHVHIGEVLPSEHYDDPETFRLTTGKSYFPVAVISLYNVISLEIGTEGISADSMEVKDPQEQKKTWIVEGSKSNKYVVTRDGTSWSCTCPGYGFRRNCRHIKEKKEEVLNL